MALTRKMLKAMGIEEEKIDQIIEAHAETVDGLKSDLNKYKADAEKLPTVQKELDDLKAVGDDGWKEKHDKVKKDFEDYKTEVIAKETKAAKEKAAKAYFESKNIEGANLNLAMRSSGSEIDGLELDGDKIKDTTALDALISGDFASLVSKPGVRVDMGARLNNNGGKAMTKEDIYKRDERGRYVMSASERQKALAENPKLLN